MNTYNEFFKEVSTNNVEDIKIALRYWLTNLELTNKQKEVFTNVLKQLESGNNKAIKRLYQFIMLSKDGNFRKQTIKKFAYVKDGITYFRVRKS